MAKHKDLTSANAHVVGYVQSTDPLTVGAGKVWVDTSSGPPRRMLVRNAANTGWEEVGGAGAAGSFMSAKTSLAAGLTATVASDENAFAWDVYTINGTLTVNGQFRVLSWPST